jgi:hypothetical protein
MNRDTWSGDVNNPHSLNRWNYTHSNPINYTDPSGHCIGVLGGADTVFCLALAGATIGFVTGVAAGGIFGHATWADALAGKCGCEMQQQALMAGNRWNYANTMALTGGIVGGIAGAVAGAAPIGLAIVGAGGIILSGIDAYKTYQIIQNETGVTTCTILRALFDLAGIVGGAVGIRTAVQSWRASGSWLQWKKPSTTILAPYDVKFAVRQLLTHEQKISISRMRAMIPKDVESEFYPTPNIEKGFKYQFKINDTWVELKWHSPDTNVSHIPNSNSGHNWTAQITVGGEPSTSGFSRLIGGQLLGSDGNFYTPDAIKAGNLYNLTHILLAP